MPKNEKIKRDFIAFFAQLSKRTIYIIITKFIKASPIVVMAVHEKKMLAPKDHFTGPVPLIISSGVI
ncbi:hypothetical protein L596_030817 [Steinernema carpocapsae]|uniref:Uncharacterized protein n=1 Tax=Steinernema carpocapsae TaxID=34508 RepID=A0A4U5LNU8_STECR|nr:hypothetical protein L596_030817 [Steinernema carpocapsae]